MPIISIKLKHRVLVVADEKNHFSIVYFDKKISFYTAALPVNWACGVFVTLLATTEKKKKILR